MMRFIFFSFSFFMSFLLLSQDFNGLIDAQSYAKVWKKCQKILIKDPENTEALIFVSKIQSRTLSSAFFNPEEALINARHAQKNYSSTIEEKAIERFDKIPINLTEFRILYDSISNGALYKAKLENTVEGYIHFIDVFGDLNNSNKTWAISQRNQLAFEFAKEVQKLEVWEEFIAKYPDALQIPNAKMLRNKLAYEQAVSFNTIEALEHFIRTYPLALEVEQAQSQIIDLSFASAKNVDNVEAYKLFVQKFPKSKYEKQAVGRIHEIAFKDAQALHKSSAIYAFITTYPNALQIEQAKQIYDDLIFSEQIDSSDWLSVKQFYESYPYNRNHDYALQILFDLAASTTDVQLLNFLIENFNITDSFLIHKHYSLYAQDGELSSLVKYSNKYSHFITSEFYTDYEAAEHAQKLNLHLPYQKKDLNKHIDYLKKAPQTELAFVVTQRILSPYISSHQYTEAVRLLDRLPVNHQQKKYKQLKELLLAKSDPSIVPIPMTTLNTPGNEFSPVISADEETLFFCGQNRIDNLGGEDIFEAELNQGRTSSINLNSISTVEENEAPVGISSDGTKLILFQSGNLYVASKTEYGWLHDKSPLDDQINEGVWQGDAMISSDGNVLLYASYRENEVYNLNTQDDKVYHGDLAYATDIFISIKDSLENWTYPKNIGPVINTAFCERFPFLHPDMKTLYFSSDGHGGLGKLDVLKSTRLSDSCWTCWSEPVNLGKEINTTESDAGYKVSTSGEVAYFTQNKRNMQSSSVMFVLDVSGSMSGEKIDELKEVSKKTIQEIINSNSEVAIAAFDGTCAQPITYTLPFTKNYNKVETFIDGLDANGGTPMYEAYYMASKMLKNAAKNPMKNRIIVLMTDGDASSCNYLSDMLEDLASQNSLFRTQTIAYQVDENSNAFNDLSEIASTSGGELFEANSTNDLGTAFEQANNSIYQILSGNDNKELFQIKLPNQLRPDLVAKIRGELKDYNNKPISTSIRWEDLETNKLIGIAKSDPKDGSYFIALPMGKNYGYYVEDSIFFPSAHNLDLRNSNAVVEINNDIKVITFDQMIQEGIAVKMNNLFFEFGKFALLPSSIPELNRVAKIIKRYNLTVEIGGHTDDVGDNSTNQILSEKRAEAVKFYLISNGCNASQLMTVGYGEGQPEFPNDSEEHKAKNRRVEIKVIKK